LIHELAHLRRRDHWVRWLEMLATGLFWWYPLVWLARRQLREAEEQCCDAWGVRVRPEARRTYATALVDALDFLAPTEAPPVVACGLGQVADLKRRLTMIMRGGAPLGPGRAAGFLVACLAVVLLPSVPALVLADDEAKGDVIRFVELKKSGDDLRALETELKKKQDEIAALKEKVEAIKRKAVQATPKYSAGIRIEISGVDLKPEDLKKLVEALEKGLPGGKERKVIVLKATGTDRVTWAVPGVPKEGQHAPKHEFRFEVKPKVVTPPVPVMPPMPGAPGDKRVDNLEKKLDAVLRELEALRKAMRPREDKAPK